MLEDECSQHSEEGVSIRRISLIGNKHLWLVQCVQDMFGSVQTQRSMLSQNSMQCHRDHLFYACAEAESCHQLK